MKYYELDFLEAGEKGNGDAIALRYVDAAEEEFIHIVDGGYKKDGQQLLDHTQKYYGNSYLDHVVLTHPDGDHAAGLETVLQDRSVGTFWMNRPWLYVDELLPRFEYPYTRDGLIRHLKKQFKHTKSLEQTADENDITIKEAFQGAKIGEFIVLAPSKKRYLDTIVNSVKTSDAKNEHKDGRTVFDFVKTAVNVVLASWGQENLKGESEGTSHENEASIVQYADICGDSILLTADAGVQALQEAHDYAVAIGVDLPGVNKFQVPHHGSRRNLSSDVLDLWLGQKHTFKPEKGTFSAIVSANRHDETHPKKAVVRALVHRGANVVKTEGTICCSSASAPSREGWSAVTPMAYPNETEE